MHVGYTSAVRKGDHQKFVGGFALSGLLGSVRASMLQLGTLSLGLWVIAVDPAFIAFNSCCSCSFEPEIIKIGQSSHKIYSNNILNFQESTTILNDCTKKVWKHIEGTSYDKTKLPSNQYPIPRGNMKVPPLQGKPRSVYSDIESKKVPN